MSGSIHQRSFRSTRSPILRTPVAVAIGWNARPGRRRCKRHTWTNTHSRWLWIGGRLTAHMELQQLRYFVAVADTGTFTAAARYPPVAQPSITNQARTLEAQTT